MKTFVFNNLENSVAIDTGAYPPQSGYVLQWNGTEWISELLDASNINGAGSAITCNVASDQTNAGTDELVFGQDIRLSDERTPIAHSHLFADIHEAGLNSSLQDALDAKAWEGHTHIFSDISGMVMDAFTPTDTTDINSGYQTGSVIRTITGDGLWMCLDNSAGFAVWVNIGNEIKNHTDLTSTTTLDSFPHLSLRGTIKWIVELHDGTTTRSCEILAMYNTSTVIFNESSILELGGTYTGATLTVTRGVDNINLILTVTPTSTHTVKVLRVAKL